MQVIKLAFVQLNTVQILKTSLASMFLEPKVRKQEQIQYGAAMAWQYRGNWWVESMKR